MGDENLVDLNIRNVPEDVRNDFGAKAKRNGMNHPEFVKKLMVFYEEYETEFQNMDFNRPPGRRR